MDKFETIILKIESYFNNTIKLKDGAKGIVCSIGSYYLKLHSKSSDLDLIITVPSLSLEKSITNKDLLSKLHLSLLEDENVTKMRLITDALAPLVKLYYSGVQVDIGISQLPCKKIDLEKHVYRKKPMGKLEERSSARCMESLSDNFCMKKIIEESPLGFDCFKEYHDVVIKWAKKKKIYSAVFCYLGGYSWRLLLLYVFKRFEKDEGMNSKKLVEMFFKFYAEFDWKKGIISSFNPNPENFIRKIRHYGKDYQMHILSSCNVATVRNITRSTFIKLTSEIKVASEKRLNDIFNGSLMGEPKVLLYCTLKCLSSIDQEVWKGYVQSRFVKLLFKLEAQSDGLHIFPETKPVKEDDNSITYCFNMYLKKGKVDLRLPVKEFQQEMKNYMGWRTGMKIICKFKPIKKKKEDKK